MCLSCKCKVGKVSTWVLIFLLICLIYICTQQYTVQNKKWFFEVIFGYTCLKNVVIFTIFVKIWPKPQIKDSFGPLSTTYNETCVEVSSNFCAVKNVLHNIPTKYKLKIIFNLINLEIMKSIGEFVIYLYVHFCFFPIVKKTPWTIVEKRLSYYLSRFIFQNKIFLIIFWLAQDFLEKTWYIPASK